MSPARKILTIALLFLVFSGASLILYFAILGSRPQVEFATVLPAPTPLPEFALTDHTGNAFTRDSLSGGWNILFFGFTRCPDICPATLQQLAIARKQLVEDGQAFPRIVLISVDPERDTPEAMASYVGNFGPGITGVTGDLDELMKLTKSMGIFFAKSGDLEENYSVDHSAAVLIINPNGEWHALFSAPHTIEHFVHDMPTITDSG
jgi:protein SCO1/2